MGDFFQAINGKLVELVIAAVMVILLAIGRIIFMRENRAIQRGEHTPHDPLKVDLSPALTRIDKLETALSQRDKSLERLLREKERDDRAEFARLHARLDAFRNGSFHN